MSLIDSHCHLYYEPYINNLQQTIEDCKSHNIKLFLSISVDYETSLKNINISKSYDEIYCTIGLHPNFVQQKKDQINNILNLYNKNSKIIGIGEAGIDLFRSKDNLKDQKEIFIKQLEFSISNMVPLIIHSRDSEKETIDILESFKKNNIKFVMHCFSGNFSFAKKCLDLGGYISFSGNITFKNSDRLRDIIQYIPLDKMLVETDSPYLSPHPFRGRINHPSNTYFVAKEISKILKIDFDLISKQTTDNFKNMFNLQI